MAINIRIPFIILCHIIGISISFGMPQVNGTDLCIRKISVNDGLPQQTVTSIAEDGFGFIWLGTFDGLCRYDRQSDRFTSYRHSDREGALTESSVWSLLSDRQGTVWAGTYYGGVNYFSPSRPDFTKYQAGREEKECLSSFLIRLIFHCKLFEIYYENDYKGYM